MLLIKLAVAASNILGLVFLLFFLAYGIVVIPIDLWRNSDKEHMRNEALSKLAAAKANKHSAMAELEEALQKLKRADRLVGNASNDEDTTARSSSRRRSSDQTSTNCFWRLIALITGNSDTNIRWYINTMLREFQEELEQLAMKQQQDSSTPTTKSSKSFYTSSDKSSSGGLEDLNKKYMVKLHAALQAARNKVHVTSYLFLYELRNALFWQDICSGSGGSKGISGSKTGGSITGNTTLEALVDSSDDTSGNGNGTFNYFTNYYGTNSSSTSNKASAMTNCFNSIGMAYGRVQLVYHGYLRKIAQRIGMVLFILLALLIVWCECTTPARRTIQLSPLAYLTLLFSKSRIAPLLQVYNLVVVCMIAIVVMYGVLNVQIYKLYSLKAHVSDSSSLLFLVK